MNFDSSFLFNLGEIHLLLTCEDRSCKPDASIVWSIPGGKREKKEAPEDTAMRELDEGFGNLSITPSHYFRNFPFVIRSSRYQFIWLY